jgi:hypothetical protein
VRVALFRAATSALWLGVGLAKMAALIWLIEAQWQPAVLALLAAWSLAGLAVWLRRLHQA